MTGFDYLLKEKRISRNDIQIWGGEIEEKELEEFIKKWDLSDMSYRIIETVKEIAMTKDNIDIDSEIVERIKIFGGDGDLDLRRDSSCFRWRYIGKNSPPQDVTAENFWDKNPSKKFFMEEKEALLWGKYNQNMRQWHDDRVARAKLSYPVNGNPERVKICYKTLSEKGVISFVWFTELKGGAEDE